MATCVSSHVSVEVFLHDVLFSTNFTFVKLSRRAWKKEGQESKDQATVPSLGANAEPRNLQTKFAAFHKTPEDITKFLTVLDTKKLTVLVLLVRVQSRSVVE